MAKKKKNEMPLECKECGNRNYWTHRKTGPNPEKVKLEKYCRYCKKHTEHNEKKQKAGKQG
jgi:large subunit ribosomal protein L33